MFNFKNCGKIVGLIILMAFIFSLIPSSAVLAVENTGVKIGPPPATIKGPNTQLNKVGQQSYGLNAPLTSNTIAQYIGQTIRILLSLLGIIFFVLILYAGFLWMTAGGDDDQITKAKQFAINATIGLAVVLASAVITAFVMSALGSAGGGTNVTPTGASAGGTTGGNTEAAAQACQDCKNLCAYNWTNPDSRASCESACPCT